MLNEDQRNMYSFIKEHIQHKKFAPTYREIMKEMGIPNIRSVELHLHKLQEENLIILRPNTKRCIELVEQTRGIPVKGTIAAGQLLQIFTDVVEERIDIEITQSGIFYALVVTGNSMQGDNIHEGDYIIVREQSDCVDGDIIVAVNKEGESEASATLKHFVRDMKRRIIYLKPSNPEYAITEVNHLEWRQSWEIQGKVIAIFRRVGETTKSKPQNRRLR